VKLFITGISGLLGLNVAHLARDRFQVSGCYSSSPVDIEGVESLELDIIDFTSTRSALRARKPDVILHTAAWTNVDGCQTDPDRAELINAGASRNLAAIASNLGARFVQVSTDQLFDGESPWKTEGDIPAPINVYGETKWRAEQQVANVCPSALILRTNFFGWGTSKRASFSDWILNSLKLGRELTMFNDVFFTPILINQLADVIFKLIEREASGLFHVAGAERISKFDFAMRLSEVFGYSSEHIRPGGLTSVPLEACRPLDMSLGSGKVEHYLKVRMPVVAEGLERLKSLHEAGWPETLECARTSR
jgi:dTDP-4-dehydrorhamnose reductase